MSVNSVRRRLWLGACLWLSGSVALGLPVGARAVNEMLVYNSGDAASAAPGRYIPNVSPQTPTDAVFPADDHQCTQGAGSEPLAPIRLYVGLASGTPSGAPGDPCTSSPTGDGVCGFDITVQVNNAISEGEPRFRIAGSGFTPAAAGYSLSHNLSADGLTFKINGVNTTTVPALPLHIGDLAMERIVAEPGDPDDCDTACETNPCATVSVSKAQIVKADLTMEELTDSFDLLRLPEPDGDLLLWAGGLLIASLAKRRKSSSAPMHR